MTSDEGVTIISPNAFDGGAGLENRNEHQTLLDEVVADYIHLLFLRRHNAGAGTARENESPLDPRYR
jgi:hypothetical protein